MRKLTLMTLMIIGFLSPEVNAQKKMQRIVCEKDAVTSYRYGFSNFKGGFETVAKITPMQFGEWQRIIVYNQTLPQMYAIALGAGNTISDRNVIIEVRDAKKLNSLHCYELNTPLHLNDQMFAIMRQNLETHFPNYVAVIEQRCGKNYLVIKDKEWGILLSPDQKLARKENTY